MLKYSKSFSLAALIIFGSFLSGITAGASADSVTLFTPNTRISVPPGESITYSIDVINKSKGVRNMDISVPGIPRTWVYSLTSGSYKVGRIAVLPEQKQTLTLKVDVPMKVNKGSYGFSVVAGGGASLPLVIVVTEQGTYETEFTTKQSNMQGHSTSTSLFLRSSGTEQGRLSPMPSEPMPREGGMSYSNRITIRPHRWRLNRTVLPM
ncbi:MAG TPA: hypothetical protein PLO24_01440 [Bacteroidales bacterium]|nr:hypothetical protein [Bacteroidales bacterium]